MLSPGSKLWIDKYLDLLKVGEIQMHINKPKDLSDDEFIHLCAVDSGFVFGVPSKFLFYSGQDQELWTETERLKLLYFEFLILVFKLKHPYEVDDSLFIEKLNLFYSSGKNESSAKWMNFFQSKGSVKTEETINDRIRIRKKWDQSVWVSYMNNCLVFLDVILFKLFLVEEQLDNIDEKRRELALNVLQFISFAVHDKEDFKDKKQAIFDVFLASADLEGEEKAVARYQESCSLAEINLGNYVKGLFKRYLLDMCIVALWDETSQDILGKDVIHKVAKHLALPNNTVEECYALVESFIINNENSLPFFNSKKNYEHVVGSFSKRWMKILERNKDKLANELRESKELVFLIKKSATNELSAEEKEKMKTQFLDIVKSMPALAIFMLPGGALLLPIVLKIIPDLIPSAFRDNEIE